jgi:ribosomal protein S21
MVLPWACDVWTPTKAPWDSGEVQRTLIDAQDVAQDVPDIEDALRGLKKQGQEKIVAAESRNRTEDHSQIQIESDRNTRREYRTTRPIPLLMLCLRSVQYKPAMLESTLRSPSENARLNSEMHILLT